jgi:hypothetical protein
MAEKADCGFANLLLAEYEKCRARELNEYIDMIDTPEYQHYLATFGNEGLNHCAEERAFEERELRLACDLKVIEARASEFPAGSECVLRNLDSVMSNRLLFSYVNACRAQADLDSRYKTVREENLRLQKEVSALPLRGKAGA